MSLPSADEAYLEERGIPHEVSVESGMACVVFPNWPLQPGYTSEAADLLVRLPPGFPDVAPDMWWFDPPVQRQDGVTIPGTQSTEYYLGRSWQRWSRHFQGGQWRSGVDSLESYLALIRSELKRYAAELVS